MIEGQIQGMDRNTGTAISTEAHIKQCVGVILTTPIGSMPWLRSFGSDLFALLDRPLNAGTLALLRAATVMALQKWEPRIRVSRVAFAAAGADGKATINIEAQRLDLPLPQSFTFSTLV